VALDDEWRSAKIWLERLRGRLWGFKVGSVLFAERGPGVIDEILSSGFRVFLDLKYHDIPNTVQLSVRRAISWGVSLVTVHASGGRQMLEAAAAEQTKDQLVAAVTVLTSLDQTDISPLGFSDGVRDQVYRLAELAKSSSIRALVSSPQEVFELRKNIQTLFL